MTYNFKGKTVLITGGTGSLGQGLLRRIKGAKEIRVFSRSETGQIPLKDEYPKVKFILGDVSYFPLVRDAVSGVDVVIHAAAFKFLNLAEEQPRQCVVSNIIGTINIIDAVKYEPKVKICLGISTDKVAYARNVYGCTKHIMEKLFREASKHSKTIFCCARYGNVLGTTGSVLKIWEKQKAAKKPLTVTDREMTRFFFSVNEAIDLIFYTLAHAKAGEVIASKMPAKRIYDMAVEFANGGPIKMVGLRPGEKRHETLVADYEGESYTSDMAVDNRSRGYIVIKN